MDKYLCLDLFFVDFQSLTNDGAFDSILRHIYEFGTLVLHTHLSFAMLLQPKIFTLS